MEQKEIDDGLYMFKLEVRDVIKNGIERARDELERQGQMARPVGYYANIVNSHIRDVEKVLTAPYETEEGVKLCIGGRRQYVADLCIRVHMERLRFR